jgi:hypothetical protein
LKKMHGAELALLSLDLSQYSGVSGEVMRAGGWDLLRFRSGARLRNRRSPLCLDLADLADDHRRS